MRNALLRRSAPVGLTGERMSMVGETNSIRVNNEHRRVEKGLTVRQLVEELGMTRASVERNAEVLTDFEQCVQDGDDNEIEKL
jgi:sulfur carrier protein ThiS